MSTTARVAALLPEETLAWLCEEDNPAVAALTRRTLLGEGDSDDLEGLWSRRGLYAPVRAILEAMRPDGSWDDQDYRKYRGNLWQIIFLGELWADPTDERLQTAIRPTVQKQLPSGAWGIRPVPGMACPCLTANVGRSLARLGLAEDESVAAAIGYLTDLHRELGYLGCKGCDATTLNGYCHMTTPKFLLLLAAVPQRLWPRGAESLRDACIEVLRTRQVFRCLPEHTREFQEAVWSQPRSEQPAARQRWIDEHSPIVWGDKPGWLRFGFPLSYNSDALEALTALAAVGETRRPEYEPAIRAVEQAADPQMRWTMRNSLNGKMIADVEEKGAPSRWLTLRALRVLEHFSD